MGKRASKQSAGRPDRTPPDTRSQEPSSSLPRSTPARLAEVARRDTTFTFRDGLWVGKCLICNGPIAFHAHTGQGATLEHIRARHRGGDDNLRNLAVVHARCNSEKGVRWDPARRSSVVDYDAFVARLLDKRLARWREPDS